MRVPRMPGFTADYALARRRMYATGDAVVTDRQRGGDVFVHPAARPIAYCSMKGCCVDLRDLGLPRICCNGDECGTNVLI